QSTTQPCSGPGDRNSRSARLPIAPPSSKPSATAHGVLLMCREYRTMNTPTPAATAVQATVTEGPPRPKAAPGLRATSSVSSPPKNRACRRPDSRATTATLLATSAASTVAATPMSTVMRRRGGRMLTAIDHLPPLQAHGSPQHVANHPTLGARHDLLWSWVA